MLKAGLPSLTVLHRDTRGPVSAGLCCKRTLLDHVELIMVSRPLAAMSATRAPEEERRISADMLPFPLA